MSDWQKTFSISKLLFLIVLFYFLLIVTLPTKAEVDFTPEEKAYIAKAGILKVVSIDGIAPLNYTNSDGEIVGIGVSFLTEVTGLTGLLFEYELYSTVAEALKSDYDLYLNATHSYAPDDLLLSKPYLQSETILYVNSALDVDEIENKTFAAIKGGRLPETIKGENTVYFNNREDTLNAVEKGIVDYGYGNAYSVAFYTLQNGYKNIITIPTGQEEREYCMGFEKGNEVLLSIINKSIDAVGDNRMQSLVLDAASRVDRKITLEMVLDAYWKQIFGIIFFVVAVLSFSVYSNVRKKNQLKLDILEIKRQEKEIKYLSFHDKLTGLFNRAYFEEQLKRIDNAGRLPISIIIGDINGLKITNDVFGHHEGDRLLQRVADILKKSCRADDVPARYGGDEFAIILPETPYSCAGTVCQRISKACARNDEELIPTSISLGCATKMSANEDIQKVIKDAEDMMYKNKLLESRSVRNSIISSLETSLHEKNIETREHALRLIKIIEKFADKLGLTQSERNDLNLLARLHDIGKIVVDERILNKEGELTDAEMAEIKKHSEAGFRIAESSQTLSNIAEYILSHHEWWDGTGYPQGLKGKEIPLLARILTIADAYDVMTTGRPYQEPMDKEAIILEMIKCSGKQFDPELVPVFISIIEDL